jgi:hypothetical protein
VLPRGLRGTFNIKILITCLREKNCFLGLWVLNEGILFFPILLLSNFQICTYFKCCTFHYDFIFCMQFQCNIFI